MRLNVQTSDGSVKIMANTHEIRHLTVAKNIVKALSGTFADPEDREAAIECYQELERIMGLLSPEPAVA